MWMELLASFLTFLGPLFLRYYPFRNRLRVPAWVVGLFVVAVWAGVVAGLLIFGYTAGRSVGLYRSITFVIFFTSSCFFIRDRFVRHFFVYLICYTFMAVGIGIAQFAMVRTGGGYPVMILATLLFDLITYPFIFYFFHRVLEPVMDVDNTRVWNIIWAPPLLSCMLISVATPGMLDAESVSYVVIRTLLGISSIVTCAILVICLGHVREQARKEAELARMERLVRQMLDAAALENGSFSLSRSAVDMAGVLGNAAEVHFPVLDDGRNTLSFQVPKPLPPVDGDRERLLQVVLNLLSNAAKHTQDGQITLSARDMGNMVEVAVADTGEGIAPERLPGLFRRYTSDSAPDSHGLGLFIAAQIVEAHGGGISIESAPGKGTTVRFTVPVIKEEG